VSLLSRVRRKKRLAIYESPEDYRASPRIAVQGYTATFGDEKFDIKDLSEGGFLVASDHPPPLKGIVEIRKNDRLIKQCLVMYAWSSNGYTGYQFKDQVPLSIPATDMREVPQREARLVHERID
jgi:hypothetical protein